MNARRHVDTIKECVELFKKNNIRPPEEMLVHYSFFTQLAEELGASPYVPWMKIHGVMVKPSE